MKKLCYNDIIKCMFKRFLLLIALLFILPANAGEIADALDKGHNVFLYIFSHDCKYCDAFDPIYDKLLKEYNGKYSFFKIDSSTNYGRRIMYEFRATYVPYVMLMNSTQKKAMNLHPTCLLDNKCLNSEMKKFRKQ